MAISEQVETAKDSRVEITCAVRGDKPARFGVVITAHQIIQFRVFGDDTNIHRKRVIIFVENKKSGFPIAFIQKSTLLHFSYLATKFIAFTTVLRARIGNQFAG